MHHVEVEAVARDARRLLVFDHDLAEARGVALGALHDLGLVAVGLLHQARGHAAGARHDVVRVCLALVLQALAVLAGLDSVVERRLHLLGRLDTLQRHLLHEDAGVVAVEHLLHQLLGLLGDLLAALVEREVHLAAADDLADRRFRDERDELVRPAVVEDVVLGAFQVVLDGERDVDDVLVVGEHHRFLVHLVLRRVAVADLDRPHLRELDDLGCLDGERQVPARARLRRLDVLAEARDDAATTFVDDVEAAGEPHRDDERNEQPDAADGNTASGSAAAFAGRLLLAATLAAEQLGEAPIDVAPDLVEVGRPAAATAAALAPLGIVQRHDRRWKGGRTLRTPRRWRRTGPVQPGNAGA